MTKTTTTNEILAVVGSVIRLKRETLGPAFVTELGNELSRDNPQYHMMERMKRKNPHKYQYMKLPPRKIESIFYDDDTVYAPRGVRPLITHLAKKHGHTIRWIDERACFPRDPEMKMVEGFKLLPYQSSNLAPAIINECGIIEMPCGGGKTVFGIALATTIAQPTLILVHTHDLLNQWVGELRSKAILPGGVGLMGGGTKQPRHVTVATVQTLTRMDPGSLRDLLGRFGCIMLDECHHCPATTFLGVMNQAPARYRYGFTATKERKDGLHFLMHDTIGPIVASVDDNDLQAAGRSQSVQVVEVKTKFNCDHTADQWAKLIGAITGDKERNELIVQNVLKCWNDGHFPLILSDRVGHCKQICRSLQSHGMNAFLLIGEVPKQQREQIVSAAKNNLVDAIVATKVADEGLDIPNLSCLHMTTPSSNRQKTQQRVGRIRRPVEGKVSVLYDYMDTRVTACARMARERRKFYREWGFTWSS